MGSQDIVATPEEAAALERAPLLVLRPLEDYLDSQGIGSGEIEAETVGDGPLEHHLRDPARRTPRSCCAGRRGRRCRPPRTTCCARRACSRRSRTRGRAHAAGAVRLRRRVDPRRALLRHGVRRRRRDHQRDPRAARHARGARRDRPTSSSTRWSRCTPWTGGHAASRASASPPATWSASCAASTASGSTTRRASCRWCRSARLARGEHARTPEATIVHGDYRLGNTMYAHDAPARLDRDLRLGAVHDRRPARRPGLPDRHVVRARRSGRGHDVRLALAVTQRRGLPHPRGADRALRGAERPLDERPNWYQTLALWKAAVFMEGNYKRFARGHHRRPVPGAVRRGRPGARRGGPRDPRQPRTRLVKGLLVDFGGVLTTNVFDSFRTSARRRASSPTPSSGSSARTPRRSACCARLERGRARSASSSRERFAPIIGVADARGPGRPAVRRHAARRRR